jgi:hypothetical protein
VIWAIVPAAGVAVGFIVGRWWALAAAVGAGLWIGLKTEVDEVPPWFLGLAYASFAAAGICAGVLARRRLRR